MAITCRVPQAGERFHDIVVLLADGSQAQSLRYIDLSDTVWDKKAVDCLVQALNCAPIPTTSSLGLSNSLNEHPKATDPKDLLDPPPDPSTREVEDATPAGTPDGYYGSFVPPAPLLKDGDRDGWPAAVQTLRMDGCGLKANVLESLGQ